MSCERVFGWQMGGGLVSLKLGCAGTCYVMGMGSEVRDNEGHLLTPLGARVGTGDNVKFGPELQKKYLELRRQGKLRGEAARGVGVVYQTVWRMAKASPAFAEAERLAELEAVERVERALMDCVDARQRWAIQLALKKLGGKRWEDKPAQVEVTQTVVAEIGPNLAGVRAVEARVRALEASLATRAAELAEVQGVRAPIEATARELEPVPSEHLELGPAPGTPLPLVAPPPTDQHGA